MIGKIKTKFAAIFHSVSYGVKRGIADVETSKETEVKYPIHVAFKPLFVVASIVGLHVISRSDSGIYKVSYLKLLGTCIQFFYIAGTMSVLLYVEIVCDLKYDKFVLLLPITSACACCLTIYMVWMIQNKRMMDYLAELEAMSLGVKTKKHMPYLILGIFLYSLIYTVCLMILMDIPGKFNLAIIASCPLSVVSFVPSFLDLYMFSFVYVITEAIQKLKERIQSFHWHAEEVNEMASSWLQLKNILNSHNKVFSHLLRIRLDLATIQAMALFFELTCVRSSYPWVLAATIIPLVEVKLRLFAVCCMGERLMKTYDDMLNTLQEALCGPSTSGNTNTKVLMSHLDHVGLHSLLSRMESRPMAVEVWGMDKLCMDTFSKELGLVLTYLFMVIQLGPERHPEDGDYDYN